MNKAKEMNRTNKNRVLLKNLLKFELEHFEIQIEVLMT